MYTIGHQAENGRYVALRDVLMQNARTLWNKTKDLATGKPIIQGDTMEEVWALKDVSFEIKRGEAVGIIGRNGAGKSTLLKILSRITEPSAGRVTIKGRVSSLLEVGTGFHPELTGRENVYLNGTIMGMTRVEIKQKFDEIVAFAEVEKYLDTPVKRYSSGMYVRLAFAVAAHLEPEILIVDEVLAVGDAQFQKKCLGKMGEVAGEVRTVLFVSHNMAAVSQLCSKGILLQNGIIALHADIDETIDKYLINTASQSFYIPNVNDKLHKDAYFKEIRICSNDGKDNTNFLVNDPISISFTIKINKNGEKYNLFCMILDHRLNRVFAAESEYLDENMLLRINPKFLVRGKYSIHAFINIPGQKQEDLAVNVCQFELFDNSSYLAKHGGYDYGSVFGNYNWIK